MRAVALLRQFFFPRACPVCGRLGAVLCRECAARLMCSPITRRFTGVLSGESYEGFEPSRKGGAFTVRSVAMHSDVAREMILSAKYDGDIALARRMGEMLAALVDTAGEPAIVTIPPHERLHLFPKSASHLDVVADALVSKTGLRRFAELRWNGNSREQKSHGDNDAARRAMRADSFVCDISPERVVLVDDVCTTGTTLCRAARALFLAGAHDIQAVSWTTARF